VPADLDLLSSLFNVEGVRVVVTGAGNGFGQAISEVLARMGARVTMLDIDELALQEAVEVLEKQDLDVHGEIADITDAAAIDRAIAAVAREQGGIDVVFANAGGGSPASRVAPEDSTVDRLPASAFKAGIDLNLRGAFNTMQAAARVMRPQHAGRIIVTASNAGLRPDLYAGVSYVAAKAGIINVVKQAALDLARYDIHVNAIAPGPHKTNIGGEQGRAPENVARWAATVPLGRMGETYEMWGLALFLASGASSFITGTVFVQDGGALALSQAM
jgi:NAD(P)-dependent dehydrogenase (short-subunit alcohol dehydrogenase family)